MIIQLLILFLALAIGWSYFDKLKLKRKAKLLGNFPPGPMGLPFVGHLPMLGRAPHKTLCEWKKIYGPIIGFWFGYYRAVVINDTTLVREALSMNCFSGRIRLNIFKARSEDGIIRGLALSDGNHWAEQRRFALKSLRTFGLGTKTMETKVQEEINEFMNRLRGFQGKPIQVKHLFDNAVLNSLWSIIFGERMKEDDPDSMKAFQGLTAITDTNILASLSVFLPLFAQIAPKLSGFEKMIEGIPIIETFLRKQIASHNVHYVENQPRDFVDAYTDEVRKTTDRNSSFHFENDALVYTLFDLFAGGSETTSYTLSWLCAYLIHHTRVQEKLQEEIDQVVGIHRIPSLADRQSMPFTEAVINEAMRFSSVAPFAVFHRATEDVDFHGFFIPKDTMIIPNLYGIHFDDAIWGDPQNFRPERFIDSNGKFKKNENLLPFSTGKRICPGEGLGRDQLFLFTVNLFQTYSVMAAGELPSLEPHLGFTLSPKPFEMVLKTRRIN